MFAGYDPVIAVSAIWTAFLSCLKMLTILQT